MNGGTLDPLKEASRPLLRLGNAEEVACSKLPNLPEQSPTNPCPESSASVNCQVAQQTFSEAAASKEENHLDPSDLDLLLRILFPLNRADTQSFRPTLSYVHKICPLLSPGAKKVHNPPDVFFELFDFLRKRNAHRNVTATLWHFCLTHVILLFSHVVEPYGTTLRSPYWYLDDLTQIMTLQLRHACSPSLQHLVPFSDVFKADVPSKPPNSRDSPGMQKLSQLKRYKLLLNHCITSFSCKDQNANGVSDMKLIRQNAAERNARLTLPIGQLYPRNADGVAGHQFECSPGDLILVFFACLYGYFLKNRISVSAHHESQVMNNWCPKTLEKPAAFFVSHKCYATTRHLLRIFDPLLNLMELLVTVIDAFLAMDSTRNHWQLPDSENCDSIVDMMITLYTCCRFEFMALSAAVYHLTYQAIHELYKEGSAPAQDPEYDEFRANWVRFYKPFDMLAKRVGIINAIIMKILDQEKVSQNACYKHVKNLLGPLPCTSLELSTTLKAYGQEGSPTKNKTTPVPSVDAHQESSLLLLPPSHFLRHCVVLLRNQERASTEDKSTKLESELVHLEESHESMVAAFDSDFKEVLNHSREARAPSLGGIDRAAKVVSVSSRGSTPGLRRRRISTSQNRPYSDQNDQHGGSSSSPGHTEVQKRAIPPHSYDWKAAGSNKKGDDPAFPRRSMFSEEKRSLLGSGPNLEDGQAPRKEPYTEKDIDQPLKGANETMSGHSGHDCNHDRFRANNDGDDPICPGQNFSRFDQRKYDEMNQGEINPECALCGLSQAIKHGASQDVSQKHNLRIHAVGEFEHSQPSVNAMSSKVDMQHMALSGRLQNRDRNEDVTQWRRLSAMNSAARLTTQTVFDDWEVTANELTIDEKIGSGATSSVYRGLWRGTEVAIKKLAGSHVNPREIDKFMTEIHILFKLRHPNLALIMGASMRAQPYFVVMEYCKGGDLFTLLHLPHASPHQILHLSAQQKLKLALDIAKGMTYLHKSKPQVIHRDLKSLNILLTNILRSPKDEPHAKITDFGLSQLRTTPSEQLYQTAAVGTFHWMAPEILTSQPYNEAADVYSYGILLYEIFSQSIPYATHSAPNDETAPNAVNVALAVCQGLRPDLSRMPATVPSSIVSLMIQCWQQESYRRPTFEHILSILRQESPKEIYYNEA